ncbi:Gar1/Naf1 RNA binding region-domain-containing protein [Parasitella parasitica]|nr:Gar1/Naf1 RNA binding region-domain-containing protein [Parasitella parasitica]
MRTANKKAVDDEDDEHYPDGIVKTAHEIVDFVVEKPQFEVNAETEIMLAGSIFQIIDSVIVIHSKPNSEQSTLDQGSLLVYGNRQVMGEVFETFGPVARPYYSVRFNDAQEINKESAKIGQEVYFVPSYQKTQIVETEKLRRMKGTDASNVYDEEVGEDEMEFSDDEKEMEHKKKKNREKKMKKKGTQNEDMPQHHQHPRQRPQQRRQQARDLPHDFDSALAAYEQQALPPRRQQQSYADLMDDFVGTSSSAAPPPPPPAVPAYYPPAIQQQQHASLPQQQNYQSPADLVSALYKSYGGSLPTQLPSSLSQQMQPAQQPAATSARSLFSKPPPAISDLEENNHN